MLFEDLNPNSPTFGALCIGTQGIQISHERNPENTDWKWGTAINFQSVVADYILTGILSDKTGNFSLNMDTGELKMKNGTFSGNIEGSRISGTVFSSTNSNSSRLSISGGAITGVGIDENGDTVTNLFVDPHLISFMHKNGNYLNINFPKTDSSPVINMGNSDNSDYIEISLNSFIIRRNGQVLVQY